MEHDSGGDDQNPKVPPKGNGRIKKNEVRNPYGRAGKPAPSNFDMTCAVIEELSRVVNAGGNQVKLGARIAQDLTFSAATGDWKKQSALFRLIQNSEARSDRLKKEREESLEWYFKRSHALELEFADARRKGLPAPDIIPHPCHVILQGDNILVIGPTSPDERAWWEALKYCIADVADRMSETRALLVVNPFDQEARGYLETLKRVRRKLMRQVPPGWNWREQIYSLDQPGAASGNRN